MRETCAVVGSGLGGLTVAHLLSTKYNVTIIEKAKLIGMDVASLTVKDNNSNPVRIDAPMRSISPDYYPTLFNMYDYLDIVRHLGGWETAWSVWKGNSNHSTIHIN
jgi:predicted NAD/FAD-binding protein